MRKIPEIGTPKSCPEADGGPQNLSGEWGPAPWLHKYGDQLTLIVVYSLC